MNRLLMPCLGSAGGLSITLTVVGTLGAASLVADAEANPVTGEFSGGQPAYLAWALASVGAALVVMTWLTENPTLSKAQPSPTMRRLCRAPVLLSAASMFMLFGIGSMIISAVLSKPMLDGSWISVGIGLALMVIGLTVPLRKPFLWEADEDALAVRRTEEKDHRGLIISLAGLAIIVGSLLIGLAATSRLIGTEAWSENTYAIIIIFSIALYAGLLTTLAGLVKMTGATPFPHWRIRL